MGHSKKGEIIRSPEKIRCRVCDRDIVPGSPVVHVDAEYMHVGCAADAGLRPGPLTRLLNRLHRRLAGARAKDLVKRD